MSRGKTRYLSIIIFCLMVIVGMIYSDNEKVVSLDSARDELIICTSLYPIHIMALNITEDIPHIKLVNLTSPETGCLHNTQLSVSDMKTLEESDIFIVNGSGMESYLDKVIDDYPALSIVDAGKGLHIYSDHEHHSDSCEHETHDSNPHTWVSIGMAITQVQNIGQQLANLDKANADLYLRNTQTYISKLEDLKSRMQEQLEDLKYRDIITLHEAFPYFAEEFDLNLLAVVQREPGSEPSARELADTIDLVREKGVRAIFVEPQFSDLSAQAIARETGAQVYTLDPASSGPLHPDAYIEIMEKNLKTLVEALKG